MNLSPGPYRFRVIASNSAGIWNSAEAGIGLEVVPAFRQTRAFQVLVIAAFALASLAVYRMRLRRLTKELTIGFEERLDERTRIAQELHDTLLQGIVATSMQLTVTIDRLPADSTVRPQFARVLTMLRQVASESRNALQGLRGPALAFDDLDLAFAKVREELPVPESTGFRIIVDGQHRPLNPLIRDQVYRIGREALWNAFRHSGADMVEVEINYGGGNLRVAVRDTGCGIDEDVLRSGRAGHWGLVGMRECAEKIGGKLKVTSRAGRGTELDLTIPGYIAFTRHSGPTRWPPWRLWRRLKAGARIRFDRRWDENP
jgi:signal transduction histidine kinase